MIEPLYRQVRDDIAARIARGEWPAGSLIPAEPALEARYAVSRTTVRKAVEELVAEGLLLIVHGQGTRVAEHRSSTRPVVMGFSQVLREQGFQPASRDLGRRLSTADTAVAQALDIAVGAQVIELVRLRTGDGKPISISTTWLPGTIGAGHSLEELAAGSLYDVLETGFHKVIATTQDSFGIAPADPQVAAALDVPVDTPVLAIERLGFDRTDSPLEFSRIHVRADRYRPTITLRRR